MNKALNIHWMFLLPLLLLSCDDAVDVKFDVVEFKKKREQWQNKAIINYNFEYQSSGLGIETYHINVANDKITTADYVYDGQAIPVTDGVKTITGLFDEIENDYLDPYYSKGFYLSEIIVEYDDVYGYPKFVKRVYKGSALGVTCGNYSWNINDFTPIK